MLYKPISIISLPILILNLTAGLISFIWLAILGKWYLIFYGFSLYFIIDWLMDILMLPNILFAQITIYFFHKKSFLQYIFGFISQFYTNLLIMTSCFLAFLVCSYFYNSNIGIDHIHYLLFDISSFFGFLFPNGKIEVNYIPYLLWSWVVSLQPWRSIAKEEGYNETHEIILFSASVFYLLFLISIFISQFLVLIIIIIFGVVQLIVIPIFNMYVFNQMQKEIEL